jgi:hypothetical protein
MRWGVKGWANTLAPKGRSASLTAFMTAAGAPAGTGDREAPSRCPEPF